MDDDEDIESEDDVKSEPPEPAMELVEDTIGDSVHRPGNRRGIGRLSRPTTPPVIILPNEGRDTRERLVPKRHAPPVPPSKPTPVEPAPSTRPVPPPKPNFTPAASAPPAPPPKPARVPSPTAPSVLNVPSEGGTGISRPSHPPPAPPSYEQAISNPTSPVSPHYVQVGLNTFSNTLISLVYFSWPNIDHTIMYSCTDVFNYP